MKYMVSFSTNEDYMGHFLIDHTACVQVSEDSEPDWLYGTCTISRSPVVHVGDSSLHSSKATSSFMLTDC